MGISPSGAQKTLSQTVRSASVHSVPRQVLKYISDDGQLPQLLCVRLSARILQSHRQPRSRSVIAAATDAHHEARYPCACSIPQLQRLWPRYRKGRDAFLDWLRQKGAFLRPSKELHLLADGDDVISANDECLLRSPAKTWRAFHRMQKHTRSVGPPYGLPDCAKSFSSRRLPVDTNQEQISHPATVGKTRTRPTVSWVHM